MKKPEDHSGENTTDYEPVVFRKDFRIGEPGDVSGLPHDPNILLSVINTDLRDNYRTLDELCIAIDADRRAIERTLDDIGYVYDPDTDQFKPNPYGRSQQ